MVSNWMKVALPVITGRATLAINCCAVLTCAVPIYTVPLYADANSWRHQLGPQLDSAYSSPRAPHRPIQPTAGCGVSGTSRHRKSPRKRLLCNLLYNRCRARERPQSALIVSTLAKAPNRWSSRPPFGRREGLVVLCAPQERLPMEVTGLQ